MVFAIKLPNPILAAVVIASLLGGSLAVAAAPGGTPTKAASPNDRLAAAVSAALQGPATAGRAGPRLHRDHYSIVRFYHARFFRPVWVRSEGTDEITLTDKGRTLLTVLQTAYRDGLDPQNYLGGPPPAVDGETLRLSSGFAFGRLDAYGAWLELRLSRGLVAYAQALRYGRVPPDDIERAYAGLEVRHLSAEAVLTGATSAADLTAYLDGFRPRHAQYDALRSALAQLRRLERTASVESRRVFGPARTADTVIHPGDRHGLVPDVRAFLTLLGDYSGPGDGLTADAVGMTAQTGSRRADLPPAGGAVGVGDAPPASLAEQAQALLHDAALEQAVRRFQSRHGLAEDGVIGPNTWRFLRLSLAERRRIVRANMERLRWLPDHLGDRHVLVNIAGQSLEGVEHGQRVLSMRVVVGRSKRPTPRLSSAIRTVVLNPTWSIPETVLTKDVLPKVAENIAYLAENRIEVFAGWGRDAPRLELAEIDWADVTANPKKYRFRQLAGEDGALGRMKFDFANTEAIYLHDTPYKSVFRLPTRARSSGCIRLEDPLAVLRFLLTGAPQGSDGRTRQAFRLLDTGQTRWVSVAPHVPLYLVYLTAFVEDDRLNVRDDIYGLDPPLFGALDPRPEIRTAARQ